MLEGVEQELGKSHLEPNVMVADDGGDDVIGEDPQGYFVQVEHYLKPPLLQKLQRQLPLPVVFSLLLPLLSF